MPNQAYTYSPSVNDDGSYNLDSGTLVARSGGGRVDAVYEENQMTGERQYLVTEEDHQQDGDYHRSTDEEYISYIHELYPNMNEMLAFGKDFYSPEFIIDFNNAINSEDDAEMWKYLEMLAADYEANVGSSVEEETLTDETEVSPEEIEEAIQPMLETEPEGMETAYGWLQQAEEYQVTHPVYSAVCAATASFHDGSMTASEAISSVIDNYPMKDVLAIYKHLTQA